MEDSTSYHGVERRQARLEHSLAEMNLLVAKVLQVSENNNQALARLDKWVETHEADYRTVRERVLVQEVGMASLVQSVTGLTATLDVAVKQYAVDRNRLTGAWVTIGVIGSAAGSIVALLKVFGVL